MDTILSRSVEKNYDGQLVEKSLILGKLRSTAFLSNTILDHRTSEGDGSQIFKGIDNFHITAVTAGHFIT